MQQGTAMPVYGKGRRLSGNQRFRGQQTWSQESLQLIWIPDSHCGNYLTWVLPLLGKDSFQEVDIAGVVMPITKHSFIVKDVTKLAKTIRHAFVIAKSGRPGPVLVDITKDVTANKTEFTPYVPKPVKPYTEEIEQKSLEKAAQMIQEAKRPFIFVGGGAVAANAWEEVRELAHKIQSPVTDSLMEKVYFPAQTLTIQVCWVCTEQRPLILG